MDALTFISILISASVGFSVVIWGALSEARTVRQKALRKERQEIIDAVMAIRPLSANPDVVEVKRDVIDAITKRNSRG